MSRPLVNAGTAGIGAPFVSAAEDVASVGTSLVAIFTPILVIGLLLILAVVLFRLYRFRRRWLRRRATVQAGAAPA